MKITATERMERIAQRKTTAANLETVVEVFKATRNETPAATVAALIEKMGYAVAVEAVAELVNTVGAWDARIFPSVREWASEQPTAATPAELEAMNIFQPSDIHPAHINQIGEAMRDYTPAAEPEKAAEAPEAPAAVPMFPNLCEALSEEADRRKTENRFFIENGFFPSWAKEHQTDPERGLKQYSTPKKWEAYQGGTLSREKAVEIAVKRGEKEIDKWHEEQLAKLRTAAAAPDLGFVSVSVEWSKNRTWGANPTATARTSGGVFTGYASGCGYDKESAAVAEALNQSPAVMRTLYTAAENAMESGKAPVETGNTSCVSWRDILGYGSGYSLLPYFEGGVGVSCFWSIFKVCGYDCRSAGSGKMFDAYTVERKGA